MSHKVTGNLRGLAPSELRRVDKLANRRVSRNEIVSLELAREIYNTAQTLRRRIGVLISRQGNVEEVFVGTKDILYLPDLPRYRLHTGRLRRLRLVFSDLSRHPEPHIPTDIYADLEKLRLDMVVSVKVNGNRSMASYAHIVPSLDFEKPTVRTEKIPEISCYDFDFSEFIKALEEELSAVTPDSQSRGETTAVLVGVYEKSDRHSEASMEELGELAKTAGLKVVGRVMQKRDIDPRTLLGKGKMEEVVLKCLRAGAQMIVFDRELKPSQWRAITNSTDLKVIDRSMLILDIFAQRANSSDGRLQVELAQLRYNLPRLVEKDAGLSRLTGGIGGRGPGETKLEIGRRRIRDRINELEKRIDKLSAERQLRRARRQELPLVAILGYTNVGKSTLFNALTGSQVFVENKLFATLDPAHRRFVLSAPGHMAAGTGVPVGEALKAGGLCTVILTDTVGFIRNLPDELKNAFRATLEELNSASFFLHVLDASDPELREHKESVEKILLEMGLADIPRVVVLNKIDLVAPEEIRLLSREFQAIPVSAKEKQGLELLTEKIQAGLFANRPQSRSAGKRSAGAQAALPT